MKSPGDGHPKPNTKDRSLRARESPKGPAARAQPGPGSASLSGPIPMNRGVAVEGQRGVRDVGNLIANHIMAMSSPVARADSATWS